MDATKRRNVEAKRANVIYFLNRHGRVEQPHLIRIHHCCHSGVHLRDVKRWLAELRGEEMPDSFVWSYQRRYKNGFVWKDVTDDDLITPISDYEYVLQGSLPRSATESKPDFLSSSEEDDAVGKDELKVSDVELPVPDPPAVEEPHNLTEDMGCSPAEDVGSRSCSWRASEVFRSFLACREVSTDDSAHLSIPRRAEPAASGYDDGDDAGGVGGGSKTRSSGGNGPHGWVTNAVGSVPPTACRRSSHSRNNSRKSMPAAGGKSSRKAGRAHMANPKCSQCGKPFNPEKLLSHMGSCRGLKSSGGFKCSLEKL